MLKTQESQHKSLTDLYAVEYALFSTQLLRNSKDVRNFLCFQRKLQIRTSSPTQTL